MLNLIKECDGKDDNGCCDGNADDNITVNASNCQTYSPDLGLDNDCPL